MSDKKISQLPAASDTDVGSSASYEIPVVVNGTTKKVSNSQVLAPVRQELQSTDSKVTQLSTKLGDLSDLETTDKSSIVNAINEARQSGGGGGASVAVVDNLNSDSATAALSAKQGKLLKGMVGNVENAVKSIVINLDKLNGYSESLEPSAMTTFLQNAIDSASAEHAILLFPKDKTLTIAVQEESHSVLGTHIGIIGKKNVEIDLNGCTIGLETNNYNEYAMLYIPYDAVGFCVKNGTLKGDRDTHILDNPTNNSEWNYCIQGGATNVVIDNVKCCNVRGDGMFITSELFWNHVKPLGNTIFSKDKDIDSSGELVDGVGYATTSLLDIAYYKSTVNRSDGTPYKAFIPRPTWLPKDVTFKMSLFYKVAYYNVDGEEETFISLETKVLGDTITPPSNATHMRLVEEIEDPSLHGNWWLCLTEMSYNLLIKNCEVCFCGRNGITPQSLYNTIIDGCYIHDIGGVSNHVAIDFEGSSYTSKNFIVKNTRVCNDEHFGVALAQGTHFVFDNCDVSGIYGQCEDVQIYNCTIGKLMIDDGTNKIGRNYLYPQSTCKNSIIKGNAFIHNGIIENCAIYGSTISRFWATSSYKCEDDRLPVFNNCRIFGDSEIMYIGFGKYNNCVICSNDKELKIQGHTVNSNAVFAGCHIYAKTLSCTSNDMTPTFIDCEISIYSTYGNTFSCGSFKKIERCNIKGSAGNILFDNLHFYGDAIFNDNVLQNLEGVTRYGFIGIVFSPDSKGKSLTFVGNKMFAIGVNCNVYIDIKNVSSQNFYIEDNILINETYPSKRTPLLSFPSPSESVTGKCYIKNNKLNGTYLDAPIQDNIIEYPNNAKLLELFNASQSNS